MTGRGRVCGWLLVVTLVACGEPLSETGRFSSEWLEPPEATTTSATAREGPAPEERLQTSGRAEWENDRFGRPGDDDPAAAATRVWARAGENDTYVQASRYEIATALPRVAFPARIPAEIRHITSQLVFEAGSSRLNDRLLAAFGLWAVLPYSVSRSVGQWAALTVADARAVPLPSEELEPCEGYPAGEVSCRSGRVGDVAAWVVEGEGEVRLVWGEGGYRYELLCRPPLDLAVCAAMAVEMVPLEEI